MGRIIGGCIGLLLAVLSAGCAGNGPAEVKLGITDPVALAKQKKAIVIISSQHPYTTNLGIKGIGPLNTSWSTKDGTTALNIENFFTTGARNMKSTPQIVQVNPGKYNLLSFSYKVGTAKVYNAAGMRGLPLAGFSIKAGEVLYIGNMSVHTVDRFFKSSKPDFKLTVEDHSDSARAHLMKKAPALAAKMHTRLLKVSPLLKLMQQMSKK